MNFFEKRKWKKHIHHLLHESRHVRNMREDLVEASVITEIREAEDKLEHSWKQGGAPAELEEHADRLHELYTKIYPMGGKAPGRELVEVVVVALIVAMALRAYFIQPFKIPTGSMQPTLNGITYDPVDGPKGWTDRILPIRIAKFLVLGKSYKQWTSDYSGKIGRLVNYHGEWNLVFEGGLHQKIPGNVTLKIREGDYVTKGDLIANGWKNAGDHIFVDKIRYNFLKPKRGQVFVFNTAGIKHAQIKQNNYYIKRLCGLPGDTISIEPPHLLVNNEKLEEPFPFYRVSNHFDEGYNGYVFAQNGANVATLLSKSSDQIVLQDGEYLPLGDNSKSSLDGRYFGGVQDDKVVGPAFFVYWPFTPHWGVIH